MMLVTAAADAWWFTCCGGGGGDYASSSSLRFVWFLGIGWLTQSVVIVVVLIFSLLVLLLLLLLAVWRRKESKHSRTLLLLLLGVFAAAALAAVTHRVVHTRTFAHVWQSYASSHLESNDDVLDLLQLTVEAEDTEADPTAMWRPKTLQLLNESECAHVARGVLAARADWMHVDYASGFLPFFTLGAYHGYCVGDESSNGNKQSSRTDFAASSFAVDYRTAAPFYRERLLAQFPALYTALLDGLSRLLDNEPVHLVPRTAAGAAGIPGFHVLLASRVWAHRVFRVHFDEILVPAAVFAPELAARCDIASRISFTLPISLPVGGGVGGGGGGEGGQQQQQQQQLPRTGLDWFVWNTRRRGCISGDDDATPNRAACIESHRSEYELGQLVLHSGLLLHRIGNWQYDGAATKARITLQGFGYRCGDAYYIYW
jgi:hypothetical protein